jgi:hypothetical protein
MNLKVEERKLGRKENIISLLINAFPEIDSKT